MFNKQEIREIKKGQSAEDIADRLFSFHTRSVQAAAHQIKEITERAAKKIQVKVPNVQVVIVPLRSELGVVTQFYVGGKTPEDERMLRLHEFGSFTAKIPSNPIMFTTLEECRIELLNLSRRKP